MVSIRGNNLCDWNWDERKLKSEMENGYME